MPSLSRQSLFGAAALAALVLLTAVGLWKTSSDAAPLVATTLEPVGIMGTDCRLSAIHQRGEERRVVEALGRAEAELRHVEALMSSWIEESEISRVNRAKKGVPTTISPDTFKMLSAAQQLTRETGGAFDVTCRPLVELWRRAGREDRLPGEEKVARALALVGWRQIDLEEERVIKRDSRARVDPGGIAKGYGIDRAAAALEESGLAGGLVDVGGDLRVFGRNLDAGPWRVQLRSPIDQANWAEIVIDRGAVCTSGHYARGLLIQGQRYSHIIDPGSGHPVAGTLSVTVIAPTAMVADAWATALSVLGERGLEQIPIERGIEGLVVFGTEQAPQASRTRGFPLGRTAGGFPQNVKVVDPLPATSSGS